MTVTKEKKLFCDICGSEIKDNRYIREADGRLSCERCYFRNTYLEGIVSSIEATYLATLEAFVSTIDAREHEVGNHSLRVMQFAVIIGKNHGIHGRDLVDLYIGSLLHDIGKIGIPDAILLKKGPLTPEEQVIMQRHPDIGYTIISHIGYLAEAAEIIWTHHEHFDGSGYPRGLKGTDIPLGARVFALADILDALTVKRPYRDPMLLKEAQTEIQAASGKMYDPSVVDTFTKASDELKDFIGKIMISSPGELHPNRYPDSEGSRF